MNATGNTDQAGNLFSRRSSRRENENDNTRLGVDLYQETEKE